VRFIILLGVVSFFADATYESARSILGPFLASLGATGVTVGLIAGFGELLNNGLRVFFGYFADRSGRYWAITIIGFAINMASVPLLAFASSPFVAAALVFLERAGKAVRNPPRDAMLSSAAQQVGHGWRFGLQEALGQVGAVVGPLLVALEMSLGYGYRFSFALMAIPAVLTLAVLLFSRKLYPDPGRFETEPSPVECKAWGTRTTGRGCDARRIFRNTRKT
jgi:MFS family permease